eukprot:gene57279-78486_t
MVTRWRCGKLFIAQLLPWRQDGARNIRERVLDNIIARRPGPSVQEVFDGDRNPAPSVMRVESPAIGQSSDDVSIARYFAKDWHDREVGQVWRKIWQLACRLEHIPNIGDHIVYDIVHDSLIVVRTGPDEIKAYINSCLHRGTMLRTEGGCVKQFRCPFHGWTWKLDGAEADHLYSTNVAN